MIQVLARHLIPGTKHLALGLGISAERQSVCLTRLELVYIDVITG